MSRELGDWKSGPRLHARHLALACSDTSEERGAFLEGARQDLLDAVDRQPLANENQVDLGSI